MNYLFALAIRVTVIYGIKNELQITTAKPTTSKVI